jgi:hypothetical protein
MTEAVDKMDEKAKTFNWAFWVAPVLPWPWPFFASS